MTTSEKAVEVLKTKYGIDARIYEDNVYLAVWNDDLSDTIDVEASKGQVEDWASEYEEKQQRYSDEPLKVWRNYRKVVSINKHTKQMKKRKFSWLEIMNALGELRMPTSKIMLVREKLKQQTHTNK